MKIRMKTLTVRLPAALVADLEAESRERHRSKSDIVRERLKVYHRQTKPLVEYYAGRPSFSSIDGNRAADIVTAAVHAALDAAIETAGPGVAL